MKDFVLFLRWRFGITVAKDELNINSGHVLTFILSPEQVQVLRNIQKSGIENKKISVESWIANTRRIPLAMQSNGYEIYGNQLILSGSELFIEAMLESLFGSVNKRSEETYIIPIDQIIRDSKDTDSVRFLNSLVNSDEFEQYKEQFIPLDSLDVYTKSRTGIKLKTGLLVGLALSYRNLRSWCAGFDRVQYTGMAEKNSEEYEKAENYRANEMACQKGMNDCLEYLRLLGWR